MTFGLILNYLRRVHEGEEIYGDNNILDAIDKMFVYFDKLRLIVSLHHVDIEKLRALRDDLAQEPR